MKRFIPLLLASSLTLAACASSGSGVQRTTVTETRAGGKVEVDQRLKKADLEQQVAASAGLLGALEDAGELNGVFGSSGLDADMGSGFSGLYDDKGTPVGSGGLGLRSVGQGGGGVAGGLGGMGTAGYGRATKKKSKDLTVNMTVEAVRITSGKLDTTFVHAVVKRHERRLRYCVEREAYREGGAPGVSHHKTTLELTINKGNVEKIKPIKTSLKPNVEACLIKTFKRARFPKTKASVVIGLDFEVERTKDMPSSP